MPSHRPQALSDTFVRPATWADLDALVRIEQRCFETDRLSRRSFRHFLKRGKGAFLIYDAGDGPIGYALVHFHAGTALARLYSFAVLPEAQGRGVGRLLLEAAEDASREQGCLAIRLEIRRDNEKAKALYSSAGYRELEQLEDYYEDHEDAVRMEKSLAPQPDRGVTRVPYYAQTLEFTCGPASLMMAMKSLNPDLPLSRKLELQIWREATTIFMTSGLGGCGPDGLALAAHRRGYEVELILKDEQALFVDSVRSAEKKEVIALVHEDFKEQILSADIAVRYGAVRVDELETAIREGAVPVVLISSYRLYGEKTPHWVVVTDVVDGIVYLHEPYVDYEENRTPMDCMNVPILSEEFEGMARYGRSGQRAVVILKRHGAHV
ncbi:MAG: ribosomal protein S18-alanine N-acetyltransferase [Pseudomonadota bacterium]|nr:ribosomal protein S18-alanine N-acetyltransferase [Pseudomonadota bacterium]